MHHDKGFIGQDIESQTQKEAALQMLYREQSSLYHYTSVTSTERKQYLSATLCPERKRASELFLPAKNKSRNSSLSFTHSWTVADHQNLSTSHFQAFQKSQYFDKIIVRFCLLQDAGLCLSYFATELFSTSITFQSSKSLCISIPHALLDYLLILLI